MCFSFAGRIDHANLVINVVPRTTSNVKPADVDLIASQTLANAKTAEEYVSKALEMKQKYEHTTPSSSYVKYDIFEGQKTKLLPVEPKEQHESTESIAKEDAIGDMTKSASEYSEYYNSSPEYAMQTTTTTTYKHPELGNYNYKDLESANSDFSQHYSSSNYDNTFDSIKNLNQDTHYGYSSAITALPSKQEMISYIEKAVKKYLREMDLSGKLTGSPSAQAEIKTYYRFPSTTPPPPPIGGPTKIYSTGTHSEFFKPGKHSYKDNYLKSSYSTVKPFTIDSDYIPENVDLTVRSKKRQKPIDLSALDVGQSWSHTSQISHQGEPPLPPRRKKKKKPKIHLNSQTYHDINALPYAPNRGLIYDEHNPYSTALPYTEHGSNGYSSHKDHSVGASISFGGGSPHSSGYHSTYGHNDETSSGSSSSKRFVPSMQVVNGIPVTNPYKFNMDTLK